MCDKDKNNGGSDEKPSPFASLLSQVPKEASKIFILTPDILESLGIASHMRIKKNSPETTKHMQSDISTTEVSKEATAEKSKTADNKSVLSTQSNTNKGIKRKRNSVSDRIPNKKEETLKFPISDSSGMDKRLTSIKDKSQIAIKHNEEEMSSCPSSTKKMRRESCASNFRYDEKEEIKDKDTKPEEKSVSKDAVIGTRNSRRVCKPKKFDDYELSVDAIDRISTNEKSTVAPLPVKRRSRVSSGNSYKTESIIKPSIKSDETLLPCSKANSRDKVLLKKDEQRKEEKSSDGTEASMKKSLPTHSESAVCEPPMRHNETKNVKTHSRKNSCEKKTVNSEDDKNLSHQETIKFSRDVNCDSNSPISKNRRSINTSKISVGNLKASETHGSPKMKKDITLESIDRASVLDKSIDPAASKQQNLKEVDCKEMMNNSKKPQIKNVVSAKSVNSRDGKKSKNKRESPIPEPGKTEAKKIISKTKMNSIDELFRPDNYVAPTNAKTSIAALQSSNTIKESKHQTSHVSRPSQKKEKISDSWQKLRPEDCSNQMHPNSGEQNKIGFSMSHLPRSPDKKAIAAKSTRSEDECRAVSSQQASLFPQGDISESNKESPSTPKLSSARNDTKKIISENQVKSKVSGKMNLVDTEKSFGKKEVMASKRDSSRSRNKNKMTVSESDTLIFQDEKQNKVSTVDSQVSTHKNKSIVQKIASPLVRKKNINIPKLDSSKSRSKKKIITKIDTPKTANKSDDIVSSSDTPISLNKSKQRISKSESSRSREKNKVISSAAEASRRTDKNEVTIPHGDKSRVSDKSKINSKLEIPRQENETIEPEVDSPKCTNINEATALDLDISNTLSYNKITISKSNPGKHEVKVSEVDALESTDENTVINSPSDGLLAEDGKKCTSKLDTFSSIDKKEATVSTANKSSSSNKSVFNVSTSDTQPLIETEFARTNVDESSSVRVEDHDESRNLTEDERRKPTDDSNNSSKMNISSINEANCKIEGNVSMSSSVSETAEGTAVTETAKPEEDASMEKPKVANLRKRGRPKNKKASIEAPMQPAAEMRTESPSQADILDTNLEATVETTGRVKKPVKRDENEIDGKGLSDGSDDQSKEEIVVKRPRGRPVGVISCNRGRSRGRAKGRSRPRIDYEYIPRERSSREPQSVPETFGAADDSENLNVLPPGEVVECGKCKEKMLKKSWYRHNLMKHNDMGWRSDQPEPDFANDEQLLRTVLMAVVRKKKRKGFFTCETCGDEKRSAHGFISHLQFCGKTEDERKALLVTCPICGTARMPSSMEMHERYHRQMAEAKEKAINEPTVISDDNKGKRKAAEKAASKISEFTELVKEDQTKGKKRRRTNQELAKLIEKPHDPNNPSSRWRGLWKGELSAKGKANCRYPGCDFSAGTMESMFEHNLKCPFTPRLNFVCRICKFSHESEAEVLKHARLKHGEGSKQRADPDFQHEGSTDSEEYATDQSDDKHQRKSAVERTQRTQTNVKFLDEEIAVDPKSSNCYWPAIRWTMELKAQREIVDQDFPGAFSIILERDERKNYRLRLFEHLSPNSLELLDNEDALNYLPKLETSMRMKEGTNGMKNERGEWTNWQRFQGKVSDGTPTFFTGGPVWALAWLTIPSPMYDQMVDQFVAVSTHPTMESVYSVGKFHVENNLIQIWNLGHLGHRKNADYKDPHLSYGVAHDKGTIWCLEWCPSGCYEHASFHDEQETRKQHNSPRRMGLLAAACSDGCVHIFSLPFPEDLQFSNNDDPKKLPIYQTKPVITLTINAVMYEKGEQNWQCTKLNWTKELGHDTIIAGFSNGYIALWDLNSQAPLLVTKHGETTFIDAFHNFYAHGHAISLVKLIPYGEKRFFISGSYDRFTKIWNLDDTSYPLSSIKKGTVTDGAWFTNWPGYVASHDDVMIYGQTYFMSLRQSTLKTFLLLPNNSTTYSVDVSDYGNSVGHGTLAGEILVMFPHVLWHPREMDRELPRKRWLASTTQVVDITETEVEKAIGTNSRGKEKAKGTNSRGKEKAKGANSRGKGNNKTDYVYMPETYEECSKRFGIVFRDNLTHAKRDVSEKTLKPPCSERLSAVNVEQYPFASINRVAWNPNSWSYLWLCVGYQNGMVRCLNFNAVSVDNRLNDLLPSHAESMLKESRTLNEATRE